MGDVERTSEPRPRRKRHKWKEPIRNQYETLRQCVVCDLYKITDHNAWLAKVYYRDARTLEIFWTMPECDRVE
jgi:hypothetical protein